MIALLLPLIVTAAQACPLKLVYPAVSPLKNPVDVTLSLDGDHLIAIFNVRAKNIHAKQNPGPNDFPYQGDVVELFVSVEDGKLPYYEFELSPYNHTYEVRVDGPGKPFVEGISMGLGHEVKRTATGWTARMDIPLQNLGWKGDPKKIVGNAYAIQGKSPNRSFWALTMPPQKKPNFHKPEFFKPLLGCK